MIVREEGILLITKIELVRHVFFRFFFLIRHVFFFFHNKIKKNFFFDLWESKLQLKTLLLEIRILQSSLCFFEKKLGSKSHGIRIIYFKIIKKSYLKDNREKKKKKSLEKPFGADKKKKKKKRKTVLQNQKGNTNYKFL